MPRRKPATFLGKCQCECHRRDKRRKLTPVEDAAIREGLFRGERTGDLAKRYGVTPGRISQIKAQANQDAIFAEVAELLRRGKDGEPMTAEEIAAAERCADVILRHQARQRAAKAS